MRRILNHVLGISLIAIVANGCASGHPKLLTPEMSGKFRTVTVLGEINTPTSLGVPQGGGLLGMAIAMKRAKSFTEQVRATIDFQKFAETAVMASFVEAIKQHPGWNIVPSNGADKVDAAFLLSVEYMGVGLPLVNMSMTQRYYPEITISATLIANYPFEVVRKNGQVQVLDPTNHPILYKRVENIKSADDLPRYSSQEFSGNAEIFTTTFRKAIDVVVKRIADSLNGVDPKPVVTNEPVN